MGPLTLRSRAVDDSANLETPGAGVTVTGQGSYSISGTISPVAAGSGATVTLGGAWSATVTANGSGAYTFNGLDNGEYTVSPSKAGYAFTPASQAVTVSDGNVSGVDFTGSAAGGSTHSISGSVTPSAYGANVTITLTGAATASTVTNASGNFVISGLMDGTYTLTPSQPNVVFSPAHATATLAGANITGVTFSAAGTQQTLFTTQTPMMLSSSDGQNVNYELGTKFQSDISGHITAVRFWKSASESGTHVGRVWSSTGTLLASVTFANETSSGWQQQTLATPLAIAANTTYVVSVNTGNSYYVARSNELATQIVNGNLRSVVGNNGVFGVPGAFPNNSYNSTNYYRDVVFVSSTAVTLTSVSLSQGNMVGGTSQTGMVTLNGPAPAGGALVTLLNDNPAATVPESMTVAEGTTSATFTVNSSMVSGSTAGVISGIYNEMRTAILIVDLPTLASVTLDPASVVGGSPSGGSVTLNGPAQTGGAVVALSDDSADASVPTNVTVPEGATSANFTVSTNAVGTATSVVISGTYNATQTATLTINPPVISALSLNPASGPGGISSTGTVTLSSPAPAGGAAVTLSSDNGAATVAPSVAVAEGATTANFSVDTVAVGTATSVTITGTYNGTQSATLTLNPPVLSSVSLNPASLIGGVSSTGTVTLSSPAPAGGALVTLSADHSSVSAIEGVYSVAGLPESTSTDWVSLDEPFALMSSGAVVPVTGQPGLNMTVTTATSLPTQLLTSCATGGDCGWWGNFAPDASVLWVNGTYDSQTGWWAANGPLTITFSSPQRGLGMQIMADESGPFTAMLCAYDTADTLLGCVPFNGIASGAADNSAIFAGLYDDVQEIAKVTIDNNGPLYPHDLTIGSIFVTGARRQMVPASVTVPAGDTSASFTVSTDAVSALTSAEISGTYATTQTGTLQITPAVLSDITLTPASVVGGTDLIGTATLTGTAPAGGAVVTLSANNPVTPGLQKVTTAAGMAPDGSIDWAIVGSDYDLVASGTTVPVAGLPGLDMTFSVSGNQALQIVTNCPGMVDCGWSGNFAPGAQLIWVGGTYDGNTGSWIGNGPITLNLSSPQHGVGFRIMADEVGPLTATLCAYDAADTLLGCKTFAGDGTVYPDNSAIYAGLYDDVAEIAKVTIDAGGTLYPHDFAIGQVFISHTRRMVPPSVKVQPGANSVTFRVNTDVVGAETNVTITGDYGTTQTGTLTVYPDYSSIAGVANCSGCSYVQSSNSSGSGMADPTSYLQDVTAGNLLLVWHAHEGGAGTTTVTDSQGNTYYDCSDGISRSAIDQPANDTYHKWQACMFAFAESTGPNTVRAFSTNCEVSCSLTGVTILEYSGVHAWDSYAQNVSATSGTGPNNLQCGNITPRTSVVLLICSTNQGTDGTAGTSPIVMNMRQTITTNAEDAIWTVTGTGSINPTMSIDTDNDMGYVAQVVGFR
jgi:Domain of unknown function (DUF4082)